MLLVMAAFALAFSPLGTGFSGGITTGDPGFSPEQGCVGCHGPGADAPHDFASQDAQILVEFRDADDAPLTGVYEHGAEYTITITLDEQNEPDAANRAGFNFFIDAGALEPADDASRVTDAGDEATHTGPGGTQWSLLWTAPDEGAVTWRLYVNDVDGDGSPSEGDQVYRVGGWMTDSEGAMPGAVEEEEVHVGVPLPQYWLGLLALAGMVFIIVFGFVYLKYVSPHNTDDKDR